MPSIPLYVVLILLALAAAPAFVFALRLRRDREELRRGLLEALQEGLGREAEAAEARDNRLQMRLAQADSLLRGSIDQMRESMLRQAQGLSDVQNRQLAGMTRAFAENFASVSQAVNAQLSTLRASNEEKLEAMRATVEEKMETVLQSRLNEHFRLLAAQLGEVEKGLGEMRSLAGSVDTLTRVMTNVKVRGTLGEVQLGAILSQFLAPGQYAENVETVPGSGRRVEFALKMPGAAPGETVWLPIDSKFPREDWERLEDARSSGDREMEQAAQKALRTRFESEAKDISSKYLRAPETTAFAVMFLPTENLYAELLRMPGLAEKLQRELHVMPAGPTVTAALLNSLQVGFRTLAVQERSAEVWKLLAAVKSEFAVFAGAMDSVQKKLSQAEEAVNRVQSRTRRMSRSLEGIEAPERPGALENGGQAAAEAPQKPSGESGEA
ncbi:DNA recombination protein RmuC [Mesosutterella sp. OilRF-GAM-744-9]|uniref:DNA recombination protein RmuC n=1 Tax=Mesosutterella porci TaxID=2915351 RepID=A0ABS9MRL0_9BURK|nr:DNA recombination protein RmuC [Mesosutterella sp. oilRF-744-WT-GAM-9]MCG5030870.1 DNA recombination protein RmuC [Mesosutterella sp. oilRF-744-WT-GAM-9]